MKYILGGGRTQLSRYNIFIRGKDAAKAAITYLLGERTQL